MNEPLLSIHCMVYNHEPYLRQCLDGFVMQRTDFPFEAIVHDDCSTDNSAAIIREYAEKYPDIIKPILEEENQYRKIGFSGIDQIMFANTRGKYIAVCEGDDYWTDPNKLQMQVDYMESHPQCGLIYTQAEQYNQETGDFTLGWAKPSDFESLIQSESPIITLTVCYRKKLMDDYYSIVQPKTDWLMSDYPKWLYIASKNEIIFSPMIMGVYRSLPESASHSNDIKKELRFSLNAFAIRRYFADLFHYEHCVKGINTNEFNYLCKISVRYDENLFLLLFHFAINNKLFSPKGWLKMVLYSTSWGRSYHRNKYD